MGDVRQENLSHLRQPQVASLVTAHVTQDWEVDGDGNFQACTNNCVETTHAPDDEDIWTCAGCGHDGAGAEFNP